MCIRDIWNCLKTGSTMEFKPLWKLQWVGFCLWLMLKSLLEYLKDKLNYWLCPLVFLHVYLGVVVWCFYFWQWESPTTFQDLTPTEQRYLQITVIIISLFFFFLFVVFAFFF